jgi:hypothetical protein
MLGRAVTPGARTRPNDVLSEDFHARLDPEVGFFLPECRPPPRGTAAAPRGGEQRASGGRAPVAQRQPMGNPAPKASRRKVTKACTERGTCGL